MKEEKDEIICELRIGKYTSRSFFPRDTFLDAPLKFQMEVVEKMFDVLKGSINIAISNSVGKIKDI